MARDGTDPSPEQLAKLNRQRVDREDGARALDEVVKQGIAVRKNMARLRELRLAKETEEKAASSHETSKQPKGKLS
jgi:hypothetical protein